MLDLFNDRDASPADAAVIAALYNASVQGGDPVLGRAPKDEVDLRRLIDGLGVREALVVLERGKEVVAWGLVQRYSDRSGYRFCGEMRLYVRPDRRRQGSGTRLRQALLARCRAYGYHHLLGRIWAANTAGLAFCRSGGYAVVGIQREIGYLEGKWQDVVILQRLLDPSGPEEVAEATTRRV